MATVVLRERHWKVHHLGVGVPPPDVAELADAEGADLVVIGVTWPPAELAARQLAELLSAPRRRVLLGQGAAGATMAELVDRSEQAARRRRRRGRTRRFSAEPGRAHLASISRRCQRLCSQGGERARQRPAAAARADGLGRACTDDGQG